MTDTKPSDPRSGIAIIIVLGILSVLMVLAVAFAISMRTESAAAGYYAEIAKSRAMVHTALARALADLDQELSAPSGTESYPSRWSQQAMDTNMANAVHLYIGDATNLLPRGIYEVAGKLPSPGLNSGSGTSVIDKNAAWNTNGVAGFWIDSVGGAPGVVGNNLEKTLTADVSVGAVYRLVKPAIPLWSRVENGRIAYLIVNLSGLLDAQFVGDENTPRGPGSSLAEIDVSQLSDKPNMATLEAARAQPFESLYELSQFGGFSVPPTNWSVYSRYPAEAPDGLQTVDVSGDYQALLAGRADIERAFDAALANVGGRGDIPFKNLIDYVDPDFEPGNLGAAGTGVDASNDGPFCEPIPMINEMFVTNRIVLAADGKTINSTNSTLGLTVEWFFPFVQSSTEDFTMEWEYALEPSGPPYSFLPVGIVSGSATITRPQAGRYTAVELIPRAYRNPSGPNPTNVIFTVVWTRLEIKHGGTVVDRAPVAAGEPMERRMRVDIRSLDTPNEEGSDSDGYECVDPRLNFSYRAGWKASDLGHTPSSENAYTTLCLTNATVVQDGSTELYVANRELKSVGELGYIFSPGSRPESTPLPWKSIWLFQHEGHADLDRVLDYFTISNAVSTAGGPVFKGRVNPNSEVTEALASVFYKMGRNDRYYGEASAAKNTWGNATNLVARIRDYTFDTPFEWPSDMGRLGCATNIFAELGILTESELKKEAFYRNCASLVHTRQNLFLILLAGQTANDPSTYGPPFGVPRTDQRAMAVVWRDPIADADGRHPCFVRWFTWLTK